MEIMNMLADLIMKLNHNLLFWAFERIKYRTIQKKKFWTDRLLILKMIDALFFVFKRKKKKKKEKKIVNLMALSLFKIPTVLAFSWCGFYIQNDFFLRDLTLQIGCGFYTMVGSTCMPVYGICHLQSAHCHFQSTVFQNFFAIYSPLFAIYSRLFASYSLQFAIYSPLFAIYILLFAIYSPQLAMYSPLFAIYSPLFAIYMYNLIISYFCTKTFCGYSLDVPHQDSSNEYPQHVFMEK